MPDNIAPYFKQIINKTRDFAKSCMKDLHSSHGWDHVERVLTNAKIICESEPQADPVIVELAVLLHDIARNKEDQSKGQKCHAVLGAEMAQHFLQKQKIDQHRILSIIHCIASHRFRNNQMPKTIEAQIVYDADKLDSIGAIGIGRAFLFSGEIGARLHNKNNNILDTQAYSDEDTAYREYIHKLQHVENKMITNKGKRLARERTDFMKTFFDKLQNEMMGLS